jgi:integrase
MNGVFKDPNNPKLWMINKLIRLPDGKRGHVQKKGFYSKKEALNAIPKIEAQYLTKRGFQASKGSFSSLIDDYLDYKKDLLKPSSWYTQKVSIEKNIKSFFLGMATNAVFTQFNLKKFRSHLIEQSISQDTKNVIIRWLYDIADFAVTRKIITTDMYLIAKLNSAALKGQEAPKIQYSIWTKDQYKIFISTFSDNDRNKILFQWLFFSGCRVGEARALVWDDFDPNNQTIRINKNIISKCGDRSVRVTTPKTKAGTRMIVLSNVMTAKLLELRDHYDDWNPQKYIFFNSLKPIGHTSIARFFDAHTKMANLPHIRVHDIRHSTITWLIQDQQSREDEQVIKYRHGHDSLATTIGTYFHHDKNKEKELAEKIIIE